MKEAVRMRAEEKRKGEAVPAPVRGLLVSLCVYLGGVAALAWLMVSGAVTEPGGALTVLAVAAAFLGGLSAPGRSGGLARSDAAGRENASGRENVSGRSGVPNALLSCGLFAAVLALAGLTCWRTVSWSGEGGVLLGCALAGGLAASLLCGGRRKKRRVR